MSDKKSFILYTDTLSVLDELTNEQAGILFKAIKDYQNGIEPVLDFGLKMAFLPLKNQFVRDLEKWNKINTIRKEAGLKGGRPPKAKEPNGFGEKQIEPNQTKPKENNPDNVNVNVNVNVNENVNDNVSVNDIVKKTKKNNIIICSPEFEKYQKWMGEIGSHILKYKKPLKDEELKKLLEKYPRGLLKEKLIGLANSTKKYNSVYLTMLNWCEDAINKGWKDLTPTAAIGQDVWSKTLEELRKRDETRQPQTQLNETN